MPRASLRFFHRLATKQFPLSEVAVSGRPYLLTHWAMKASAHDSAVATAMGTASTNLLVLSIIVSRYLKPKESGIGPTTSIIRSENLRAMIGLWLTGGATYVVILTAWQAWQAAVNLATSARMVGQ